jgi:hypothetical protein
MDSAMTDKKADCFRLGRAPNLSTQKQGGFRNDKKQRDLGDLPQLVQTQATVLTIGEKTPGNFKAGRLSQLRQLML